MKKHFFNVIATLALVCGVFAFSGCTDFENDINEINNRLDKLETGTLASLEEQIATLTASLDEAHGLIDILQGNVKDLQDADESMKQQIEILNGEIETVYGQISDLNDKIASVEKNLSDAIESNSDEIDKLKAELESLKGELAEQTQKLTDLIETVSGLEEAVDILEGLTANLPELENLVDSIENNYLSKEEAQNTYATLEQVSKLLESIGEIDGRLDMLESLNIGDRLADLEANYKDLNDVVIPGLEEDILAAQNAADEAQKAADAAMDFAKDVLGQLETLRNALGIYAEAGALEAKMEALDKVDSTLAAKDEELLGLIEDLDASVAAEIEDIRLSISDLREEIMGAIDEIKEAMVTKDEFGKFFNDELTKALAEDGVITEAIAAAIEEARQELQGSIDAVNDRIDNEIRPLIDNLTSDVVSIIGDLVDNIQSLVFVPEYKDGLATSYFTHVTSQTGDYDAYKYGLYDGQKQRVFATFQVTPASLAASITDKNVALQVVPVKSRSFAADAKYVRGDDLVITTDESGRINVDALVSAEYGENFAIALYVADENIISDGNFEGIDAGEYVTSDYVSVVLDKNLSNLTERYVLYDFENEEEYPDLFEVEKPWTDAPGTVTFYEGYELALNLGTANEPRYVTLAEAEEEFRLEAGALTPEFGAISMFYPKTGNGITYAADEEKGYGFIASMPADKEEAVEHVGDKLIQNNYFKVNGVNVIENVTSYEIINKRYEINLKPKSIDWTYEDAKTYHWVADRPDLVNTYLFREVGLAEVSEALTEPDAYTNINDILKNYTSITLEGKRTVDGKTVSLTNLNTSDISTEGTLAIDALAFEEAQIASIYINGYEFEKGESVEYSFSKTYVNNDKHVEVVFNFDYTLGEMPDDMEINLGNYEVEFVGKSYIFTTGLKSVDKGLEPITAAYNEGEAFFGSLKAFTQSLYDAVVPDVREYVRETWKTTNTPETQLEGEPYAGLWTFLGILNDDDARADNDQPEVSYIRTSSSNIQKYGETFRFETTLTTWYGVEYTFKATSEIGLPAFSLKYDEALAPNGTVKLNGLTFNGKYDFETVDFSNYVYIANPDKISETSKGAYVRFEILSKVDDQNGIINIPTFTANGQTSTYTAVNGKKLAPTELEWDGYTATELEAVAILYLRTEQNTEIEVNRLPLTIITDDPITHFSADALVVEDRISGEDFTINLWEQLVINGILDGDKNIAMYYGEAEPREYQQFSSMLQQGNGRELYKYILDGEANIEFPTADKISYRVKDGDYTNPYVTYDPATGVLIYNGENAALQNDLIISMDVKLHHKLDYNGVEAKVANLTITIKAQIPEI